MAPGRKRKGSVPKKPLTKRLTRSAAKQPVVAVPATDTSDVNRQDSTLDEIADHLQSGSALADDLPQAVKVVRSTQSQSSASNAGSWGEPAKKYYDIKTAAFTVPSFDGQLLMLNSFLTCTEEAYKSVHPLDRHMLLKTIANKCKGDALRFLYGKRITDDLGLFCKMLREQFGDVTAESQLQFELTYLFQQPAETIKDYGERAQLIIDKMAFAINSEQSSEVAQHLIDNLNKNAATYFFMGLKDENISREVRLKQPKNFRSAVKIAKEVEDQLGWREKLQKSSKPEAVTVAAASAPSNEQKQVPKCYKCGKMGHKANVCRTRSAPAQTGQQDGRPPRKTVTCYKCGKPGHVMSACRSGGSTSTFDEQSHHPKGQNHPPPPKYQSENQRGGRTQRGANSAAITNQSPQNQNGSVVSKLGP